MDLDGEPSAWCLSDLCQLDAQEAGDGGAGEVDVQDADRVTGQREGEGELGGYGGLSDSSFAGEDLCVMVREMLLLWK